ncbi:MAG: EamA/RhaT family transporter, partial [Desulfomonilia bacterium]
MFAVLGALVRLASSELPNEVIVFFRNALALLILMPILVRARRSSSIRPGRGMIHFHLFRAATGLGAMYCYFHSLAHMKLA